MKPRTFALSLSVATALAASVTLAGTIAGVTVKPVPNGPQSIAGETTGPDGNVWFVAWKNNAIGRVASDGSIKLFPLPTPNASPDQITTGGDGNLWFTEQIGNVGRITPEGTITEFPAGVRLSGPIVRGSDGAIWFMEATFGPQADTKLARIMTGSPITTYDLNSSDGFATMASGPDGRLWLYDTTKNAVVTFSPAAGVVVATYAIPTAAGSPAPRRFAIGPDNNMWLTHNNSLVRIKPDGTMTDYPLPTPNANPSAITYGGDGSMWFTEYSAKKLGQLIVSTATDSGQATINESDALLASGAIDLTLLAPPAAPPQGSSSRVVGQDITDACAEHIAYSWYTIDGVWYAVTFPAGPNQTCVDVAVSGAMASSQIDPARHPITTPTVKWSVGCYVTNNGPGVAENVVFLCSTVNAPMALDNPQLSQNCTMTPATNGVIIRAGSLAKGEFCTFTTAVSAPVGAEFGLIMNAGSDGIDDKPFNNINSIFYQIHSRYSYSVAPNKIPVAPGTRGH